MPCTMAARCASDRKEEPSCCRRRRCRRRPSTNTSRSLPNCTAVWLQEKQSKRVLALCYVAIPLAICAFLLGCGGMAVLMGRSCLPFWAAPAGQCRKLRWQL